MRLEARSTDGIVLDGMKLLTIDLYRCFDLGLKIGPCLPMDAKEAYEKEDNWQIAFFETICFVTDVRILSTTHHLPLERSQFFVTMRIFFPFR